MPVRPLFAIATAVPLLLAASESPSVEFVERSQSLVERSKSSDKSKSNLLPEAGVSQLAQIQNPPQSIPRPPDLSPPLPEIPPAIEPLPDPSELLPSLPRPDPDNTFPLPDSLEEETVTVQRFAVVGSTVFSDEQIADVLQPFLNQPLTFGDLLAARDAVTELYVNQGFITSGAFIPADQVIDEGVVTIQVLEGRLADIKIQGTQRLKPAYIRSHIGVASGPPLNIEDLLQALQLLQRNPVIDKISAELVATPNPGENDLVVQVGEAETFDLTAQLSNYETPLLSTFQQVVEVRESNLSGNADVLDFTYQHAGRSNVFELDYERPVSPYNSKIALRYSYTSSEIVEFPLSLISPQAEAHVWEVGVSHPLLETPVNTFTLGLHLEQRISQSYIEPKDSPRISFGFPGTGATDDGYTQLTVLQFSQAWQHQTPTQLITLDSRFRLGTSLLGATGASEQDEPSTNFFAWQGQALWLQKLDANWLLVTRAAGQVADRPLVASELFGIGGAGSVRGYRKDQLLADNGFVASVELQTPIINWPEENLVGILAPFFDFGYIWNSDDQSLSERSLASVGAGLIFRIDDRFTARLDYALPIVDVGDIGDTWQEAGFLFVMRVELF